MMLEVLYETGTNKVRKWCADPTEFGLSFKDPKHLEEKAISKIAAELVHQLNEVRYAAAEGTYTEEEASDLEDALRATADTDIAKAHDDALAREAEKSTGMGVVIFPDMDVIDIPKGRGHIIDLVAKTLTPTSPYVEPPDYKALFLAATTDKDRVAIMAESLGLKDA